MTDDHPNVVKLIQERNGSRTLYKYQLGRVNPKKQGYPTNKIAIDQISQELTSQLVNTEVQRVALENRFRAVQSE